MSEEYTWTNEDDDFECPHCHEKFDLSDNDSNHYTQDGYKIDCPNCEKPLDIYGSMSWSWDVYKGDAK